MHDVILCLGSNINPEYHLFEAIKALASKFQLKNISNMWETEPVGSKGPNYFNIAVAIETQLTPEELKEGVIRPLEKKLGRHRTANKNANRTIDVDIILWDGEVIDSSVWERLYLLLTVTELQPDLIRIDTGETIQSILLRSRQNSLATLHSEVRPGGQ